MDAVQDLDDTEMQEAQQDLSEDQTTMEELIDAGNVLCTLRDHTAQLVADREPVNPSTVAAIRAGVDIATSRISDSRLPVIALESMDADCLGVTLESISVKLKQVWEAVKAAFKKFFASIISMFTQRGQNAEKAAAVTDQTIKQLAAVSPSAPPPPPEKTNKPNVLRAFTVGNKLPADFLTRIPAILKGLEWVFVDNGAAEAHLEQLANIIAHRPVDKLNDPELSKDIIAFITGVGQRYQAVKGDATGLPAEQGGDALMTTGLLLGDVIISVTVPGAGQSVANTMASVTVALWDRRGQNQDLTVPNGITREQLTAALEASKEYLSNMASFSKSATARINAVGTKVLAAGDQLVSRGTPETEGNLTTVTHMLKRYVTNVMNIRALAMRYGYELCGALNALAKEYATDGETPSA